MSIAKEEKELYKFVNDPVYREKIIAKVHKEQDNQYKKSIKQIESERDKLFKSRTQEITRIANSRWEKVVGGKLLVNRTEGKIKFNQSEVLFSSIQGADLNIQSGFRVVTTEQAKSKKHASLGGAVLGAAVLGPLGAVAGGVGLGKTKTKGTSVSNQIPTCTHIGVMVNIDGFVSEITLLSSQVDQSSTAFSSAHNQAQNLISQLGALAKKTVPHSFLRPEEESSVKSIDSQIEQKQDELQTEIADRPTYALPEMYRSSEQQQMSDEDYLAYLEDTDKDKQTEREQNKELDRQKKAKFKDAARQERAERRANADYAGAAKTVRSVATKIVFWILSVVNLIFCLIAITSQSGVLSGILFLLTGLLINPLVFDLINNRLFKMTRWVCIIILIGGFIAGTLTFPSITKSNKAYTTTSYAVVDRNFHV